VTTKPHDARRGMLQAPATLRAGRESRHPAFCRATRSDLSAAEESARTVARSPTPEPKFLIGVS
jgi:hypothetical protein